MVRSLFVRTTFVFGSAMAMAACTDSTAPPTPQTQIQFVNAIATSPQLGMSLNGVLVGGNVKFRDFTGCQNIGPGTYTLTVTAAGSSVPIITAPVTIASLAKYDVIVTGTMAAPQFNFLPDSFAPPTFGRAVVRPFNALPYAQSVDAYVTPDGQDMGVAVTTQLPPNTRTGFVNVPSGRVRIQFTSSGQPNNVLAYEGPFNLLDRWAITEVLGENPGGGGYKTFVVPACY